MKRASFCTLVLWAQTGIMVFSSPVHIFAQAFPFRSFVNRPLTEIAFRQDLNAYTWLYAFQYAHYFSSDLELRASETFTSSMLRIGESNAKWKDDQSLTMLCRYSPAPSLNMAVSSYYTDFSDQQSGFRNDIQTTYIGGGASYLPHRSVFLGGSMGGKWDSRYGYHDRGYNYDFDVHADEVNVSEYHNSVLFQLSGDDFSVRQNRDLNAHYSVFRSFAPGVSDSLLALYEKRRRDNYFSIGGDIETYEEEYEGLSNYLKYRVFRGVDFSLSNSILYKNVDVTHYEREVETDRRRREDRRFDHWLGLSVRERAYNLQFRMGYSAQLQQYDIPIPEATSPFSPRAAFVAPDNESSRFTITNDSNIRITPTDSLASRFSASIFRYDTPDTSNYDDRDELRINATMLYQHQFSPAMKLQVIASVNLFYMVFIFAEQSADNNWNRIFRLASRMYYDPSARFRLFQSFEVLANYIDYDFESELDQTRSFVFRKFVADDSLSWDLTKRTNVNLQVRLLLEENGRLFWDEWSERPLIARANLWSRVLMTYRFAPQVSVSSGIMYYQRKGWRYTLVTDRALARDVNEKYLSWGPVVRFEYMPSSKLSVEFKGTRQMVKAGDKLTYYLNNLDLRLNWYL